MYEPLGNDAEGGHDHNDEPDHHQEQAAVMANGQA